MEENKIEPASNPPEKRYSGEEIKTLRTYAGDMADAIREQQGSVIKIAVAEERRRESERAAFSPTSKKNLKFIAGGIILALLAGGIFWYIAAHKNQSPKVETPKYAPTSLVPSDETQIINIDSLGGDTLAKAVVLKEKIPLADKKIRNIVVVEGSAGAEKTIPAARFLSLINSSASPSLLRSMDPDFMLGVYENAGNPSPFAVFKINSYEQAFIGMLAWERKLFDDWNAPFSMSIGPDDAYLFSSHFIDTIIENRDGRVLLDKNNKMALGYVYMNTSTLVIATNEETMRALIGLFDHGK